MKDAFLSHIDGRFDKLDGKIDDMSVLMEDLKKDTGLLQYIRDDIGDIKDDTDAIQKAVALMEDNLESKLDNVEHYMKGKLGSIGQKLKLHWDDYKKGDITKKQFIFKSLKTAGKKAFKMFGR